MLALGGGLRGAPVVITFETLAPGAAVESQFSGRGITFSNARCVDYGLQIGQPDGFAHSGRKGIEPCFAQEFCSVPLDMTFALEQRYVKVWVGYANRSTFNLDIQLRGDFGTGSRVAMATLPPSDAPTPIRTPLQVVAPPGSRGFLRAQLSATIDGQPASYFAVDDVEFDTMEEPACAPLLGTGGGVVVQDMNGDGVFDPIAEAIQLLSWAFLGASAPVAPCCAGGGPSGLPDTGQTRCSDDFGTAIPCDSATCPGQDGFYATGCSSEGRFTDNGDGTVTDHCTGLQWQKDTADTNGDGQSNGEDSLQWCDALAYCENLRFAGHDDWRLPNVRELESIVDYGRNCCPPIDPVFGGSSTYWSSTSCAADPDSAWVLFNRGSSGINGKLSSLNFVRGVRGGRAPVVITFETLAPGAAVESQFSGRGITFSNARCVDYGLQIGQPDGFAHSGRKGIEPCFAQEFCSVPLDMTFALEQRYVKVWVGYANRSTFNLDIQLRADFGTGSRVATATLPPSDAPTPIRTPLQVVAPRGSRGFVRAQLSATIDGQPASYFAVDDVEFDTMEEPACAPLLGTGGGVVVQDMNGDGVFDPITEAIQLLSWAFLGASAPVAPCCAGGGPSGLPDTGQTKCYDASGAEISCDSATCPGQDGFYATGCSLEGRFTDNGDGTVTDLCTGLQWQKDTADTNGDGQLNGGDFIQWCDALAYCENLSFAGHDDWRLPNVRELQSILDYGRSLPAIDPVFRARSDVHSSSTSRVDPADSKWYVIFERGQVGTECKELPDFVRAVRSRP